MWTTVTALCFYVSGSLIVYTYVIYPALAVIIGGSRTKPESNDRPGISVIVPAYNEAEVIAQKIDNFRALDYPEDRIEMLIVDDGSTDATREIVQANTDDHIHLLAPAPRAGKAVGLNRMIEASKHPFVPKRLSQYMQNPEIGAVTGEVRLIGSTQEIERGESLYYLFERRIQEAESRMGSVMGVDGGMYLLRKDIYQPLPADTILDDLVISMQVIRSGRRVVYDGDIKATESGTPTSRQEFSRRVRMIAGVVQLLRRGIVPKLSQPVLWFQFASHKLLRWIGPLLLLLVFASNTLILSLGWPYRLTFTAQLGFYMTFIATATFRSMRSTQIGSIVFYFVMSQIAIVVGLLKGFLNLQPVVWDKGKRSDTQSTVTESHKATS